MSEPVDLRARLKALPDAPERRRGVEVVLVDDEILALGRILGILQGLDPGARRRVAQFAREWSVSDRGHPPDGQEGHP